MQQDERCLTVAVALGVGVPGVISFVTERAIAIERERSLEFRNNTVSTPIGYACYSSSSEHRGFEYGFCAPYLSYGRNHPRYGDRISIDDPLNSGATRSAVEAIAARYGILISDGAPVTAGYVNAGTARIVVTRSVASVPGCSDWSKNSENSLMNETSTNFGCAVNGNLAAMIANPEDLVRGSNATGQTVVMSSNKAIDAYREVINAAPENVQTLQALEALFESGVKQLEIGEILEPLYQSTGEWEKLIRVREAQLTQIEDPEERVAMYQRIAEDAEERLLDPVLAFVLKEAAYKALCDLADVRGLSRDGLACFQDYEVAADGRLALRGAPRRLVEAAGADPDRDVTLCLDEDELAAAFVAISTRAIEIDTVRPAA